MIIRPSHRIIQRSRRRQAGFLVNTFFDQPRLANLMAGTGEPPQPTTDANIWGWWKSDAGITKDGSNNVVGANSWLDQSGLNHHFGNNSSNYPIWFDNVQNGKPAIKFSISTLSYMLAAATLNQPWTVYMLLSIPSYVDTKVLLDGGNAATGMIQMNAPSPRLQSYGGSGYGCDNSDMAFDGTYHILTGIFNGASSVLQVDNVTETTGSIGTSAAGGVYVGTFGGGGTYNARFDLLAMIVSAAANNSTQRTKHKNWLAWYGGITI